VPLAASKPTGRPRQYPALKDLPAAKTLTEVAQALPKQAWRQITWRQGTKGPMRSRFAAGQGLGRPWVEKARTSPPGHGMAAD